MRARLPHKLHCCPQTLSRPAADVGFARLLDGDRSPGPKPCLKVGAQILDLPLQVLDLGSGGAVRAGDEPDAAIDDRDSVLTPAYTNPQVQEVGKVLVQGVPS